MRSKRTNGEKAEWLPKSFVNGWDERKIPKPWINKSRGPTLEHQIGVSIFQCLKWGKFGKTSASSCRQLHSLTWALPSLQPWRPRRAVRARRSWPRIQAEKQLTRQEIWNQRLDFKLGMDGINTAEESSSVLFIYPFPAKQSLRKLVCVRTKVLTQTKVTTKTFLAN